MAKFLKSMGTTVPLAEFTYLRTDISIELDLPGDTNLAKTEEAAKLANPLDDFLVELTEAEIRRGQLEFAGATLDGEPTKIDTAAVIGKLRKSFGAQVKIDSQELTDGG